MDPLSVDSNMFNGFESRIRIQRAEMHDAQVISGLNRDRQSIGHCLILVALVLLSCLRGCGLALSLSGELGSMPNTLMKQSSAGTNWMADLQLSPHSAIQIRPDPGPRYRISTAYISSLAFKDRTGISLILVDSSANSPAMYGLVLR